MAKNISLLGADYPDVPAVQLPQTGGGTATFYDIKVIDDLNSESSTDALSAKQGKVLNNKLIPTQFACPVLKGYGLSQYGWDGCVGIKIDSLVIITVALTAVPSTAALTPLVEIPSAFRPSSRRAVGAGTKGANGDETCSLLITQDRTGIMANTAVSGFVTGTIVYTI